MQDLQIMWKRLEFLLAGARKSPFEDAVVSSAFRGPRCIESLLKTLICILTDSLISCYVYLQFHRFESYDTTGIFGIFQDKC